MNRLKPIFRNSIWFRKPVNRCANLFHISSAARKRRHRVSCTLPDPTSVEALVQQAIELDLSSRVSDRINIRPEPEPDIEHIISAKLKKAKDAYKIWALIIRHERYLSVSLICLAMVRLRRLSRRKNTASNRKRQNRAIEVKGLKVLESLLRKRANGMNTRHIATVLHSMAVLGMNRQKNIRKRLMSRFMPMLEVADAQSISNILWAFGKLDEPPELNQIKALVGRLLALSGSCNSQNLANTIWSLGTLNQRLDEHTLEQLLSCYICKLPESVPQGMTNVLWAVARLEFNPGDGVINLIVEELVSRKDTKLKPQDIANAIWSIGRLQCALEAQLLDNLFERANSMVHSFNQQELSLTLWGLAKIEYDIDSTVYYNILEAVELKHHNFTAQALSTTLWSMGKIGKATSPQLLHILYEEAAAKIRFFTPQGLSNVLWAAQTLNYNPGPHILGCIVFEIAKKIRDFKGKNMASILKSFATLQYLPDSAIMRILIGSCVKILKESNTSIHSICIMLWSIASLKYDPGTEILNVFHSEIEGRLDECSSQHLANILWSYGTITYDPKDQFIKEVMQIFVADITEATSQGISNTMWAVASLGYHIEGEVFNILIRESIRRTNIKMFSGLEMANIIWAVAIQGNTADEGVLTLWEHIMRRFSTLTSKKHLSQLFHAKLLLESDKSNKSDFSLPKTVERAARDSWNRLIYEERTSSRFHSQVSASLDRLDVYHNNEVRTHNGFLSVDIMLQNSNIVIEVDGPSHFAMNTRRMNGSTLARNNLLRQIGYNVMCIPFYDWPLDKTLQDEYIANMLNKIM